MTAFQTISTTITQDAHRRKAIARECEAKALLTIWGHHSMPFTDKIRITKNIQCYVNALINGIDAEGLN